MLDDIKELRLVNHNTTHKLLVMSQLEQEFAILPSVLINGDNGGFSKGNLLSGLNVLRENSISFKT